jgi:hypothetical protein
MEVLDIDVTICNIQLFFEGTIDHLLDNLVWPLGKLTASTVLAGPGVFSLCERNFAERIIICHPQPPLHSSPQSRIRYYYAQIQMWVLVQIMAEMCSKLYKLQYGFMQLLYAQHHSYSKVHFLI